MRSMFAALAGGLVLLSATAAPAAPTEVQMFTSRTQAKAVERLNAAGIRLPRPITVRAVIASDGRLRSPHVVTSSGSVDTDQAVEKALKSMPIEAAPPLLYGAFLKLSFVPTEEGAASTDVAR